MPELYWYLFWVGVVLIVTGLFIWGGIVAQRQNLEVLKILRTYADKGVEPPPALADQLAKQVFAAPSGTRADRHSRGALLRGFLGAAFTACVAWGLNQWIEDQGEPGWALHASWAAFAFFAVAAFGLLLAAVTTRDK
jgi:hypothetical protein